MSNKCKCVLDLLKYICLYGNRRATGEAFKNDLGQKLVGV